MLSYQLDIWQQAEEDLNETYDWYEIQKQELGNIFLFRVDECIKRILRNPHFASFTERPVRSTSLRKFPYNIYYFSGGSIINIIAVIHQSRKPNTWKRKH